MNDLVKMFDYHGAEVTVIMKDGEPLFDATNVCNILGYKGKVSANLRRLDKDEKVLLNKDIFKDDLKSYFGNYGEKWFITEPGLYVLIVRSSKPKAKAFRRWVTHEVLPSIRKTGKYEIVPTSKEEQVANALILAHEIIAEKQKLLALEQEAHEKTLLMLETEQAAHKKTEYKLKMELYQTMTSVEITDWIHNGVDKIAEAKEMNPGHVRIASYAIYDRVYNETLLKDWTEYRSKPRSYNPKFFTFLFIEGKMTKYARVLRKMYNMDRNDIGQ